MKNKMQTAALIVHQTFGDSLLLETEFSDNKVGGDYIKFNNETLFGKLA